MLQQTTTKPVTLTLPPAHSFQQFKLINGWECRYDPNEAQYNQQFDPKNITPISSEAIPTWLPEGVTVEGLPFMFPGLRFIVGACGTKFGKTFGCATRFAKEGWLNPGTINWWVAPSYAQSEMAMDEVQTRLPRELMYRQDQKHRITLLNPDGSKRSVLQFKSAEDPDLLRGEKVSFFVIDEAARGMPFKSFESVMTTVTQTMGRGIIISTPNGRGWFYDIYQRGNKSLYPTQYPEWYSLRMPTWVNPTVPLQSIKDARRNLPADSFRQEYMAEFIEGSAGVFRNVRGCIRLPLIQRGDNWYVAQPYTPGHSYVLGVDLARKRDYSVLIVMDRETKNVVYFERFNQIDWTIQMLRIINVARQYRAKVSMDATGVGDAIVSSLVGAGLDIEPYVMGGNTKKRNLVDNLRVCIEQGKIAYPDIPIMIDELERYSYKETASGVIQYEAPEGYHDDTVIALALCCWIAVQEQFIYRAYNVRGI